MKKSVILLAIAAIFGGITAHAATGDIAGTIYTTDILTFADGVPIQGYAISGKTVICLEDLADYGFTVAYDDSIRTLFVTKTHEAGEYAPTEIKRGEVGETAGFVYETDIKAVVNGVETHAYALDGKMAAAIEDLGITELQMSYSYNDDERNLYFCTDTDDILDKHSYEDMCGLGSENIFIGDDFAIHFWSIPNRLMSGRGSFFAYISYKGGADEVSLNEILNRYGFCDYDTAIGVDYPAFSASDNPRLVRFKVGAEEEYTFDPFAMRVYK